MIIEDRLEGNPEALACRERYREIVRSLGEDTGRFVLRLEAKITEDGGCVLLVTSSLGEECDKKACEMAVALLYGFTGARPKEDKTEDSL